jgi:hypothetical protein
VIKLAYKHVETDEEFANRIVHECPRDFPYTYQRQYLYDFKGDKGDQLDTYVWDVAKRQRKLVEVFP